MTDEPNIPHATWFWLARNDEDAPKDIFGRLNVLYLGHEDFPDAITHMRVVLSNTFAYQPVVGQNYATAQFLGSGDTQFSATVANVGGGTVTAIQSMVEELQRNAREFRKVKNSSVVRFENNPFLELCGIEDGIVTNVESSTSNDGTDLYNLTVGFSVDNHHEEQLQQEMYTESDLLWRIVEGLFDSISVTIETTENLTGAGDTGVQSVFQTAETVPVEISRVIDLSLQSLFRGGLATETGTRRAEEAIEAAESLGRRIEQAVAESPGVGELIQATAVDVQRALESAVGGTPNVRTQAFQVIIPTPPNYRRQIPTYTNNADEDPSWFRDAVGDAIDVMENNRRRVPIHSFFVNEELAGKYVPTGEGNEGQMIQTRFHNIPSFLRGYTYGNARYYHRTRDLGTGIRNWLSSLLALGQRLAEEYAGTEEFERLYPGLSQEFIDARRLTVHPTYQDLNLPPHPATGEVIDTDPDFYFWNDSEQSLLNVVGPEIDARISSEDGRLDRLMASLNGMVSGHLWQQTYLGRSLYGPDSIQDDNNWSLSGEPARIEALGGDGSPANVSHIDPSHPDNLTQLRRILTGDDSGAIEAAMAVSPGIVSSTTEDGAPAAARRMEMYRNTVFNTTDADEGEIRVGPIDEVVRANEEIRDDVGHYPGHHGSQRAGENIYNLAKQALLQQPDETLTMRRAFPTFKLYFIEDDTGPRREHLLPAGEGIAGVPRTVAFFDDFYSYNSVKEIRLVRSRKQPADLLIVTLINISGLLDQRRWRDNRDQRENWEPGLQDTELENPLKHLILKQGQKVQLRLGHKNSPHQLPVKFVGEVVEVSHSDESPDLITIVAQSYGTELVAEAKGSQWDQDSLGFTDTADLLHSMMYSPELVHFGRFDLNPSFNPAEARSRISSGTGRWTSPSEWLDTWRHELALTRSRWIVANNPADDNIYAPAPETYQSWYDEIKDSFRESARWLRRHITGPAANFSRHVQDMQPGWLVRWTSTVAINPVTIIDWLAAKVSDGSNPLSYYPMGKTVWEIFKEMELRHPGYVGHPRPYGSRMTMFFGIPDQRYWADEITRQEMIALRNVERRIRQARNAVVTRNTVEEGLRPILIGGLAAGALGAIITSEIQLMRLGWYLGRVQAPINHMMGRVGDFIGRTLGRFKPFRKYHLITSDHHILLNNIRASEKNTFNCIHLTYGDGKNYTLRADDNIPDNKLSTGYFTFPNCADETMARRYCIGLLMQHLKDVYKGELVVTGMNVDPHDAVLLCDSYSDMFGPLEVEQVVDTFSMETGWITEITPDLCVHANEWSTTGTLDLMGDIGVEFYRRYIAGSTRGQNLAILSVLGAGLSSSVLGPMALAPLAAGAVLFGAGGYFFIKYTQERQPVWIQPLILGNRPFIEGLHGFKQDGVFANIAGRFVAEVDAIREGWRAFHILPYVNDWTIGISQALSGQG